MFRGAGGSVRDFLGGGERSGELFLDWNTNTIRKTRAMACSAGMIVVKCLFLVWRARGSLESTRASLVALGTIRRRGVVYVSYLASLKASSR
jgi:hypothetical protein